MSFQIQKLGTHIRSKCRVTSAGLKEKLLYGSQQHAIWIFSRQCQILNGQQYHSLEETSICRPKLLWLSGCQVLSLRNFWHNNPLFGKTCAKNFTPPDFQAIVFTPLILLNFNSFRDKNTKQECFWRNLHHWQKNFTLLAAVTAVINLISAWYIFFSQSMFLTLLCSVGW